MSLPPLAREPVTGHYTRSVRPGGGPPGGLNHSAGEPTRVRVPCHGVAACHRNRARSWAEWGRCRSGAARGRAIQSAFGQLCRGEAEDVQGALLLVAGAGSSWVAKTHRAGAESGDAVESAGRQRPPLP